MVAAAVLLYPTDGGCFTLSETTLTIKQWDYEGAIYYSEGDPYPHLDGSKVRDDVVVDKQHQAIIMENAYIELTLLPEMGRVYSMVYKPTGHDVFWHNDIVAVSMTDPPLGWWMWIGGTEYVLPGTAHGTTWAERWAYRILEDSETRKAVRMSVVERGTMLEESLDIVLYPDRSYYEAHIRITNPTKRVVVYAHNVNPMWAPGGRNGLTDNTEFIVPTDRMLIPGNFGPSLEEWDTSKFRFIKGWDEGWGHLTADGIKEGFYSAYSHDEEEGIVRVFDKEKTPGVNIWTYGYNPTNLPMSFFPIGSGAPNKGYVEMWGSTSKSKLEPDGRLGPGEVVEWTEWMYPYYDTGGLTYANRDVALNFLKDLERGTATLGVCPSKHFDGVHCTVISGDVLLFEGMLDLAPDQPFRQTLIDPTEHEGVEVTLLHRGEMLAEYVIHGIVSATATPGATVVGQQTPLELTVVLAGPAFPQMRVDLSLMGLASTFPLQHEGVGRYTLSATVTPPQNGQYDFPVMVETAERGSWHRLFPVRLDVYPDGDLSIYEDGLSEGWTFEVTRGESDSTSSTFVHRGSFSHAIAKGFTIVEYVFDDPGGIDPFGYSHLECYINGGEASGQDPTLADKKLSEWGIVPQTDTWTLVSIPISEVPLDPRSRLTRIVIGGIVKEALYLDDVKLVAAQLPEPTVVEASEGMALPSGYALSQNYPNPFNSSTSICFTLPTNADVELSIFNLAGQQVATLVEGVREAGTYTVRWDGRDDEGRELASGVYLYRLRAGDGKQVTTRKLLLIR